MTREELEAHCIRQVVQCEMWAKFKGEEPSGKVYEEHKLILELLEQEPCEDAISRRAVLDAFDLSEKTRKYGGDHSGYDTLMKYEIQNVLEDLPPVTPQQARWISVSERLPEEGEEVLVSGYDTYNKKVIIAKYQGEQYGFTCGLVTAWMSLPTPYEPQESEG